MRARRSFTAGILSEAIYVPELHMRHFQLMVLLCVLLLLHAVPSFAKEPIGATATTAGKQEPEPPVADIPTADPALSASTWKQLTEQTTCEALPPTGCSGGYGFTVDNAGKYTAGPSPSGVLRRGSVTSDEQSALNAAASAYLASNGGAVPCQVEPSIPGVSDVVRIVTANNAIDVYEQGMQETRHCLSADSAKAAALTTQVQQLRQKYYPVPYPTN